MNKHIIIFVITVFIIGFAINETIVFAAQEEEMDISKPTSSDKQKIILTWLPTNDTKTSDTPKISISSEDFWMAFSSLLE